ncbi:hypothetical protein KP509_29G061200 [Ceratopteris richardii]|uniref:C2 domain-containing protein n=1 Tax=Ceratopteris richardii TaxID=49495 RepID=A0A8T2R9Z0_CERRI|nr:hypothetical protein KP509_29G061200 [Ceratopteris richardii]
MPEGTVEIELIKGHDLKDVEFIGKSDPYAVLCIGEQKHRSKTIHDGGKSPVWNESFLFEIPDGPHELQIVVYDDEKHGSDEAMGSVLIPLNQLFAERQVEPCKFKVQRPNGKCEGELELGLKFFPKVHHGVLEVHLIEAHGLKDTDTFGKSDPYAVIYCHKEHKKSRVIEGCNSDPVWDERFSFQIDNDVMDVLIKLFDKDDLKADDPLGNVVVPLNRVFTSGHEPPSKFKVLGPKGQPQGELSVALKFSPM